MDRTRRLAVFALFAVVSCSKNDPVIINNCLLTKVTMTVSSGGTVSTSVTDVFDYDPDRRLVKITETSTAASGNSNLVQTYNYTAGMVSTVKTDGTIGGTTVSLV